MKWLDVLVVVGLALVPALLIVAGVWWQLWLTGKVRAWAVRRYKTLDPESRDKLMPSIKRIPGGSRIIERAERERLGEKGTLGK